MIFRETNAVLHNQSAAKVIIYQQYQTKRALLSELKHKRPYDNEHILENLRKILLKAHVSFLLLLVLGC
jgi:hypothetical protein